MKQYIGLSRDHSRSMSTISKAAARDYNSNIKSFQQAAAIHGLDTVVSVVKCGVGWKAAVEREVTNSNIQILKPIPESQYIADGSGTPLWDSVGDLIETMSSVPDADNPQVSFLVMVITDGEGNMDIRWSADKLSKKIRELQATDRWTFVFRVPKGYKKTLMRLGFHEGNIIEWDQTERGIMAASEATNNAIETYFTQRKEGVKSTNKFYADLSKVNVNEVKQALVDISDTAKKFTITHSDDGIAIKSFIENQGLTYKIGCAFYQLSKTETIQETKKICIRDRASGAIYSGYNARDLLGLPYYGSVRLAVNDLGNYDVFIQSTSVNRKLVGNTTILIYK